MAFLPTVLVHHTLTYLLYGTDSLTCEFEVDLQYAAICMAQRFVPYSGWLV